ncbi:hypothetical protein IKE88_00760 [Candidatus Saccharibacteria bacterium]|nr:hypothetical protein [Candidatus Saccharibacteria bacterium]
MINAAETLCVAFLPNPTDPNAGTNRTNAVSRDNLMEGAGLGYNGYYTSTSLNSIGESMNLWSSTLRETKNSHFLYIDIDNRIHPVNNGVRYLGRSVR